MLFDERYKGKIGLRDDPYYKHLVAALAMGKKNAFRLDSAELKEVKEFLIAKKPIFRTLWQSFSDVVNLMKSGDMWATQGWLPMYWVLKRQEGVNVRYPVPQEGGARLGRRVHGARGIGESGRGIRVPRLDPLAGLGAGHR